MVLLSVLASCGGASSATTEWVTVVSANTSTSGCWTCVYSHADGREGSLYSDALGPDFRSEVPIPYKAIKRGSRILMSDKGSVIAIEP